MVKYIDKDERRYLEHTETSYSWKGYIDMVTFALKVQGKGEMRVYYEVIVEFTGAKESPWCLHKHEPQPE